MTRTDLPASSVLFASLTTATVRRIAVTLQCAATIAVGWAAHDWAGWHRPVVALLAGAVLVLGYFISVGWVFLVSLKSLGTVIPDDPMWDRMLVPCEQRIGTTGFIARWSRECVSIAWILNVLQPFRARVTLDASADAGRRVPMLMVHDCGCNHAVWLSMQQHLAAAGYPTDVIDLVSLLGNIDEYARDIVVTVAQLMCVHGRAPVLFCHGVGGLAA